MKHHRSLCLLTAFTALAIGFATPALADSALGVVNVQKIMHDSKAAADVSSQLQAKQKSFQGELDAKEKSLLAEDQSLSKARSTMAKDAFEQKVKDFRSKTADAQREVQVKKAQLDKAYTGALEKIQTTVSDIVKDIASEKKLSLVVTSGQVLYADPSLDITDDVLKRLDSKLPNVKVNF
ncbi:MAG: hypothetical protein B7X02_00875 [Rhodospirillales bacterium 12-54-5]|nr:MAG: hypothetical protein B7X02_00875 [Rhodospirillales bacterium 12-54-5]